MNPDYTTKAVKKEDAPLIQPLLKAYSDKLGIKLTIAETIGLALKNETKRLVK